VIIVDIVTPTRNLVQGAQVASVKIPGARGELTILPGHTELLTVLGTGPLSFAVDGHERRFAVSYGFAEIRKDKVLILAECAEEAKEIDVNRAKSAEKRAAQALTGALTEAEFKKQQLKLQRALARQQVAGHSH
jgi:F-type H+-transporting ATPase subunit epsilon